MQITFCRSHGGALRSRHLSLTTLLPVFTVALSSFFFFILLSVARHLFSPPLVLSIVSFLFHNLLTAPSRKRRRVTIVWATFVQDGKREATLSNRTMNNLPPFSVLIYSGEGNTIASRLSECFPCFRKNRSCVFWVFRRWLVSNAVGGAGGCTPTPAESAFKLFMVLAATVKRMDVPISHK